MSQGKLGLRAEDREIIRFLRYMEKFLDRLVRLKISVCWDVRARIEKPDKCTIGRSSGRIESPQIRKRSSMGSRPKQEEVSSSGYFKDQCDLSNNLNMIIGLNHILE